MAFKQHVFQLLTNYTMGNGAKISSSLDLRGDFQRIVRVNSLAVRVTSTLGTINYNLFAAGGITCAEFGVGSDLFEPFTTHDALFAENVATNALHIAPCPDVLAPFIRFDVIPDITQSADAVVNLWAFASERFDV